MATNLKDALVSSAVATRGARPVAMEAIPEAAIDVEGGAQPLSIEGLGVVKRKKDNLAVTSSTAALSTQDFFADLLDDIDYNNSDSVTTFQNSVNERIAEANPATLAALSPSPTPEPSPTQSTSGFENLFGSSGSYSDVDYAGVGGISSGSFGSSSSSGSSGSLASSSSFSSSERDTMASVGKTAIGLGMKGLENIDPVDVASSLIGTGAIGNAYSTVSNVGALASNFSGINDIAGAINYSSAAVSTALGLEKGYNTITSALNSGKSVEDLLSSAWDSTKGRIEDVYTAVTNPAETLDAFGTSMQYGSQNPDLYSYDMPGGTLAFNFDGKTGKLATPGLIAQMLPGSMGAAFKLSQYGLGKVGYTDMISKRARGMVNAFAAPPSLTSDAEPGVAGVSLYGSVSGMEAYANIDLTDIPGLGGMGNFALDLGALSAALGSAGLEGLSLADIQEASYGHAQGPLDIDEEDALVDGVRAGLEYAGLTDKGAMDAATVAAAERTQSWANNFDQLTGRETFDPVGGGPRSMREDRAREAADNPVDSLAATLMVDYADDLLTPAGDQLSEEQARGMANRLLDVQTDFSLAALGQNLAEQHHSGAGKGSAVVGQAMQNLGYTTISLNAFEDLDKKAALAANVAAINAYDAATPSGLEGATGSFSKGFGGMSAKEAQQAYNESPLSEFSSFNFSGFGNIGDAEAAADAGRADMTGLEASIDAETQGAFTGTAGGTAGAAADAPGATHDPADETDEGSWGGDGDSGGGEGGTTYICTAAYSNGVSDYSTFSANRKYGIGLRRTDPYLMRGYDLVGPRLAKIFGKTKVGKVLTSYYKMDLNGDRLSIGYKVLQVFLKGFMRPLVRTIGYVDECVSG